MTEALEDVGARIEEEARATLVRQVKIASRYSLAGDEIAMLRGRDPLEVRDNVSGETFMLEVRALPTGG